MNKTAIWAASGIVGAGIAGGFTYAAVSTPAVASSDIASAADAVLSPTGSVQSDQMRVGRRGLLNRLEHGELTVRTRQGDRTVVLQRGVVSAVSPTSISVTSPDKFAGVYTVDAATKVRTRSGVVGISSVHQGDQVFVVSTSGKAIRILDRG